MNILLLLSILIICLLSLYVSYKYYDKQGILITLLTMVPLSVIMSYKVIDVLNIKFNLGIVFEVIIIAMYIIFKEGNSKSKINLIKIIGSCLLCTLIILIINSLYETSVDDMQGINLKILFLDNYRVMIGSGISLMGGVLLTDLGYKLFSNISKNYVFKIIIIEIVVMLLNSICMVVIAYLNILKANEIIGLFFGNYIFKLVIFSICIPMIDYILKKKVEA